MTIRNRLSAIFLLVALLPLCVGYALVVAYQYQTSRVRRLDNTRLQARVLAGLCAESMAYGRRGAAETILSSAQAVPFVQDAVLFDRSGEPFAAFHRGDSRSSMTCPERDDWFAFRDGAVLAAEAVRVGERVVGRICLKSSLRGMSPGIVPFSVTMLLVLGGTILLVIVLARVLQRGITQPLYALLNATKNLTGPVESAGVPGKRRRNEFGVLRERLDYLLEQADIRTMNIDEVERAQKKAQELEKTQEKYRSYFENNTMGLAVLEATEDGADFLFCDVNESAEKLTRVHRADLIGKSIVGAFPAIVDGGLFEIFRQVHKSGEEMLLPYVRHHGAKDEPWWEHVVWRLPDERIATAFRDVSRRRREEEKAADARETEHREQVQQEQEHRDILERASQASALNQEMEGLFNAVAEDLANPLQNIDQHSMALLQKYAATLDDEGKNDLIQLRAAGHRMLQLFNEIKRLADLSRDELKTETVDLSALVSKKTVELKEGNPGRTLEFKVQKDVTAQGDPRLIGLIIDQLLTNAWLFSGKKAKLRIEFGAQEVDDRIEYHIRDNGIGFDSADAERIFWPFQKLNTEEVYPGSGMGLALVRRAVLLQGGTIRAESQPGKGTTFLFTIEPSGTDPDTQSGD